MELSHIYQAVTSNFNCHHKICTWQMQHYAKLLCIIFFKLNFYVVLTWITIKKRKFSIVLAFFFSFRIKRMFRFHSFTNKSKSQIFFLCVFHPTVMNVFDQVLLKVPFSHKVWCIFLIAPKMCRKLSWKRDFEIAFCLESTDSNCTAVS